MGVIERFRSVAARVSNDERGQMTVELAVAFPVLLIVAIIAVNACTFFHECAVFDRVSHGAVRAYATAPAYREGPDQACALVEHAIRSELEGSNLDVIVTHGVTGLDLDEYRMTLGYHPTLFGLGLRSEVLGVGLPRLEHTTTFVVDSYKPGVIA